MALKGGNANGVDLCINLMKSIRAHLMKTKHLDSYFQRKLKLRNSGKEPSPSRLSIGDANTPSIATWQYNYYKVREIAAHMVLAHEFPFSIMEGVVFNKFLREIYPWYQRITRHMVKKDCQSCYDEEKVKMKRSYQRNDPQRTIDQAGGSTSDFSGLGKRSFEAFLETVVELHSGGKSYLECYLGEVPLKCSNGVKFDMLTNEVKYHILSTMAKDILSIPITTVASEATFSAGKRVIDPKRTSMTTKTVVMLFCGGDWIKEMYGIKRGQSQSILEAPVDDPLEFHFGEEPVTTQPLSLSQ
ncbi:hypothetical protein LIER_34865 [Lithospermum erythrorhizon]|uniref:HAT C-terminal dimerisation domain-containing protein n=1 Tax=Lithospermum erythrorhizon TaxID=34254 RepID=A0AAV3S3W7_LITER